MILFKKLFVSMCLVGTCGLAQANFTYTFTGPTSLEAGQVGSFNFHVSYTPYDLSSLGTLNGWAEYSRSTAYSYQFVSAPAAAGVSYVSGVTLNSGLANLAPLSGRPTGVVSDFNIDQPFERDLSFSLSFANAGSFNLSVGTFALDYIIRRPSSLCFSDPACTVDIQESLNDFYEFPGSSSNPLMVSVSAVPELGTLGLLLAGVGVLGARVRSQRKRAVQSA